MGAVTVGGSFSSSNWERTIEQLQNAERVYHRDEKGNMVEDLDYANYSGTILSIDSWSLIKMHNNSEKEIMAEIWEENSEEDVREYDCQWHKHFDKWEGVVAEGPVVGYDLYTPTFSKLTNLPFNFREYINMKKGEYALLEYRSDRYGRKSLNVLKQGCLEECQKVAACELGYEIDAVYVICGNRGNHYKCFNTVKRVKNTSKKDVYSKLKIKEVRNYYYAGLAGC